jgi:hypothetical protein
MNEIDAFSLVTVPVQQLANGTAMNSATAFVWKHAEQHYLVTNLHVVTGRNAQMGVLETPARPDTLRALFNVRIGDFGKQQQDIRIRDDQDRPLWLVHPVQGRGIDVVAIPIPMRSAEPVLSYYPINSRPAIILWIPLPVLACPAPLSFFEVGQTIMSKAQCVL